MTPRALEPTRARRASHRGKASACRARARAENLLAARQPAARASSTSRCSSMSPRSTTRSARRASTSSITSTRPRTTSASGSRCACRRSGPSCRRSPGTTDRRATWSAKCTTCTASSSQATRTCARSCSTRASSAIRCARTTRSSSEQPLVPYRDRVSAMDALAAEPGSPAIRPQAERDGARRRQHRPVAPGDARDDPDRRRARRRDGEARRRALRLPASRLREGGGAPHLSQGDPVRRPPELLLRAQQQLRLRGGRREAARHRDHAALHRTAHAALRVQRASPTT